MATAVEFFEIRKNKTRCIITKYTGTDSVVEIPAEIGGVAVTEIGEWPSKTAPVCTKSPSLVR